MSEYDEGITATDAINSLRLQADALAMQRDSARAEVERLKSGFNDATDAQIVAELEKLRAKVAELRELCRHAHDRLLRGDSDGELLELLAESWKGKPE